ncbi:MAG: hypothetical protein R3C03_03445 [Pirellulaceae bacterium]
MNRFVRYSLIGIFAFAQFAFVADTAQAGPLLDWLRGLRNRCSLNRQPTYPIAGQTAACGLQPDQCRVDCQQTCSRTVVNYVPYTAYRTSWEKVPVTQYRPVTSSDPCTGCTVTCMKPCTTYTWSQKQVPYTTYRPVYRQETYKVPVSYVTNNCNSCNTCSTCNVPAVSSTIPTSTVPGCSTCGVPNTTIPAYGSSVAPVPGSTTMIAPNGTLTTSGGYISAPTPAAADIPPSIDVNPSSMQRPIIEGLNSSSYNPAPVYSSASREVVRNQWDYSPVRLASYTSEESARSDRSRNEPSYEGTFLPQKRERVESPVWQNKTW